jgi:enoyl-CoA hydratase/carnithine racemase
MPDESAAPESWLLEELSGGVLWLTLNRPQQRNPLSSGMITALHQALLAANEDSRVKVIVLASSGPVFSAGHDLREMAIREGEIADEQAQRVRTVLVACSKMMLAMLNSPKAIIACVQATATAAGCQLVSACDLAIASSDAMFCTPGVNIGNFCTTPLVGIGRNIHRKHAMELALTGDMFSADDAVRFGLLNRAVPATQLRAATEALANSIASNSVAGIASGKAAFYQQIDMPVEAAFEFANESMVRSMTSADAEEGISAFLEKRNPVWGDD